MQRPSITDDSRPTPASRPRQVQRPSITDDSIRQRQRTQSPSFAKTMDDSVPTPVPRAKIRRTRKPSLMDDSIPTPVPRARIRRTQEPSLMDDSIPTPIFRLRGTKQPFIAKITDDSTFTPSILKQPTRIQRSKINAPTITLWPSHKPSLLPTQAPSQKPSQTPGLLPSQKPSSIPTQKPSLIPSSNPTPIPSLKPTPIPSSAPTDYIPCNKNCPVKPNLCGFYETCGNGCWCGRFPPTPSSFPTLTPTQNLFIIAPPTMMPYTGAVSISLSPMPTLQPSSKSTQMPTTFLPTTISPTTTRPTIRLSESPTLPPPTQLPMQLQTQLPTLFPSPLPTLDQTSTILSSNGASNNSSASSNTIIASAVVGSVILLLIAIVIIYCLVRKNKKLDAFTKWRMHYDVQTPIRRDTPATIENDIHHFYKRNPSVYNKEFTPYVSKSQRSSQRNSLKPQPMSIDYNRNSIRL